mmetsp:Transcript_66501/g.81392  ORF Transcript_66501/g.81392 Transcript_66501/m.81392 type:complete len:207 (-) Transcript_66501:46-666(-)
MIIIVLGLILFETINAGFFQKVTVKLADGIDVNGEPKYKEKEFDTKECIQLNMPFLGMYDNSLQFKCQDKDTLKVHVYHGISCSGSDYPGSPLTVNKKGLPFMFLKMGVRDFDCNGLTKIHGILLIIGIIIFTIIITCVIICYCKKKRNSVYHVYGNNPQRPPMQVYVPPSTQQLPTQQNTIQMYQTPTPQTNHVPVQQTTQTYQY